jgi:hypothetical protein
VTSLVRQSGWVDWERNLGKRVAVENSVGETYVVIMDPNNSAPVVGWGARDNVTRMYLYQTTALNKDVWTLRATILAPAGTTFVDNWQGSYSIDIDAADNIHIIAKGNTGWIYYCKVTYGTWAVSAWETVATSSGLTWVAMDMAVSEANVPLVAAFYTTTTPGDWAGVKLFLRRSTPGTWAQVNQQIGSAGAGAVRSLTWDVSVCWLRDGNFTLDTTRDFMYAFSITTASNDNGVLLYSGTLDETNGTAVTGHTLRGTYTSGDVSKTANYLLKARSILLFPASENYNCVLSAQTYYPKPKFNVVRWKSTGGVWTNTMPLSTYNSGGSASLSTGSMTQTAKGGTIVFLTNVLNSAGTGWDLFGYLARTADTGGNKWGSGFFYFNDKDVANPYNVMGGGNGWSFASGDHSIIFGRRYTSGKYDIMHDFVVNVPAPIAHTPAQGEVVTSSTPPVSLTADLNRDFSQGRLKGIWQFATSADFLSNMRIFISDDVKLQKVDDTASGGKTVILRDTLSLAEELFQGTWYVRAQMDGEIGSVGAQDNATTFTVSHPPSASPVSPVGYMSVAYDGTQELTWEFSDPYVNDEQTAYQIIIENADTQAVLYDTGKVVSDAQSHVQNFVVGDKGINLRWHVRVWDMDDVVGAYSEYGVFMFLDAPTIVVNNPAVGVNVTTALPTVQFVPSVTGGRTIMKYRLTISQGNTAVYDSTWIDGPAGGWASGTTIDYSRPVSVLDNNQDYTYQIRVVDNTGLEGRISVAAHTTWVVPSSPDTVTVDLTPYNTEDQGYALVQWTEASPDVDFRAWIILRRDRLIDPITLADLEVGPYNEIGRIFDPLVLEYKDFYAPSGYSCDYQVIQLVDRFGDQIPSAPTQATVSPRSDGYWFIIPENESSIPDAFKLSNVTADSYTDEYEKEIFTVIDGGRKVDEGQHLGLSGTLNAQLRDSVGQSARQKKHRLELMKQDSTSKLYMRTPFGDLYRVYVNDLQVSRIAGVGSSEFCDVTVPYLEVGD